VYKLEEDQKAVLLEDAIGKRNSRPRRNFEYLTQVLGYYQCLRDLTKKPGYLSIRVSAPSGKRFDTTSL
jgi:hypothetical protein